MSEVPNKSDVIRDILKSQPKLANEKVQAALKAKGIKASNALINKIKYGRNGFKKSRTSAASTSKAEAIRQAFESLGWSARPRDVIAHLAANKIEVSFAQVSMIKTKAGSRITGKRPITLDDLVAVKAFVDQIGSIDVAQDALQTLAALTS